MEQSVTKAVNRKAKKQAEPSLARSIIFALIVTVLFAVIALLLASFIVWKSADPLLYLPIVAQAIVFLSAFVCGFSCAKKRGGQGMLSGACAGAIFSAMLFLLSLIVGSSSNSAWFIVLLFYFAVPLIASLGGMTAGIKRTPKRKTKKRR